MLKNKKTVYFCQECGYESAKWMGQCPGCKSWNTFVEETVSTKKPSSSGAMKSSEKRQEPVILKDISLSEDERQTTQIGELDRVLGGGIVPGSLVLVGGDPGIGKSTLLLQVCRNLAEKQVSVLYISGEESLRQIKLRANRIGQFTDKMQAKVPFAKLPELLIDKAMAYAVNPLGFNLVLNREQLNKIIGLK